VAGTEMGVVEVYMDATEGEAYKNYLMAIIGRMQTITTTVLDDWKGGYREAFIQRSGSSATESVDKLVNDFIFYYEKHLRAGKVGIPAGVFSATPLEDRVEARFKGDVSQALLLEAIDASKDFFNGISFDGVQDGPGLSDYLNTLGATKDDLPVSQLINDQFDVARSEAQALETNLGAQVRTDNSKMLETYNELQRNVVYLKVDMLQALNISVDYVDADGD